MTRHFATAALIGLLTVTNAAAKGHDQGSTADPGTGVGESTVTSAQGVATAVSGGKGKGAQGDLGKSRSAGK